MIECAARDLLHSTLNEPKRKCALCGMLQLRMRSRYYTLQKLPISPEKSFFYTSTVVHIY